MPKNKVSYLNIEVNYLQMSKIPSFCSEQLENVSVECFLWGRALLFIYFKLDSVFL